jgi:hypothetical protein
VLFGSGLLTSQIQQVATALLSGGIPAEWTRDWNSSAPESTQGWLKELVRKRSALTRLHTAAVEKKKLLSEPMNLNDLFSPSTFISALRQLTARSTNRPMDQLKLICSWEKDSLNLRKCPHTCTITGLWLQGAAIHSSSGCLREFKSDAPEMVSTPAVTIGFVPLDNSDKESSTTTIPVFLSSSREEVLMELVMKVESIGLHDGTPEVDQVNIDARWILSGTALFLRCEE